jgi:hypothetical protein
VEVKVFWLIQTKILLLILLVIMRIFKGIDFNYSLFLEVYCKAFI